MIHAFSYDAYRSLNRYAFLRSVTQLLLFLQRHRDGGRQADGCTTELHLKNDNELKPKSTEL